MNLFGKADLSQLQTKMLHFALMGFAALNKDATFPSIKINTIKSVTKITLKTKASGKTVFRFDPSKSLPDELPQRFRYVDWVCDITQSQFLGVLSGTKEKTIPMLCEKNNKYVHLLTPVYFPGAKKSHLIWQQRSFLETK